MTLHVKSSGAWLESTAPSVRSSGAWLSILEGWVRSSGAWQQFYAPPSTPPPSLTVTVSNQTQNATGSNASGKNVSRTCSAAASVSGATGAVTYSWSRVSGPSAGGAFSTINSGTSAPTWSCWVPDGGSYVETWRCTATDSVGATGYKDITVTLNYTYVDSGGGGGGLPP
jgi:hypothetical protein